MAQEVFNSSDTWIVPANVYSVLVECWGAGGGGSTNSGTGGGGGGGGGGYASKIVSVSPTDAHTLTIGNGGAIDSNGTSTSFDTDVVASGGRGATLTGGALGGDNTGANGDVLHNGGNGGDGDTSIGGGGGGSGTSSGVGNDGSGQTGGIGEGNGGNGGDLVSNATTSTAPGGGGGGQGNPVFTASAGSNGRITLTYYFEYEDDTPTDELILDDSSEAFLEHYVGIEDVLDIIDEANVNIIASRNGIDSLTISDSATVVKWKIGSANDTLSLSEVATRYAQRTGIASDNLSLTELASRPVQSLVDLLFLAEIVTGSVGKYITETLVFTEAVSAAGSIYHKTNSDNITVTENAHAYKQNSVTTHSCPDTFSPSPALGLSATTTFSYPYTSPTNVATLRNPKFNNNQTLETGRIYRETRGHEQKVGDNVYWLKLNYLHMEFEALTLDQATDLIELLEASAGDEIKLVDWENRTWRGFIVSNPNDIIIHKDDDCQYSAALRFEGVLVS